VEERIEETLDLVGLADKADRAIKGFSGGERQRLGIAQAQVNHPDLLILDEPAAALDPQGRHDVLDIMARLRQHTTIFYSTHILEDVQRISDNVAIMNKGALVAQAPIEELLNGGKEITYTFKTRGASEPIRGLLNVQPWVSAVKEEQEDGHSLWQVSVTNEDTAEDNLMRLVASVPGLRVAEFGRQRLNLEEVFLDIIEGENGKEGAYHGN
jgi:ABC-2 type transport system ATP-binding protein